MAVLVDRTLLRAIEALVVRPTSAETLLIVREAILEGADEMRHAGHAEHSFQLGLLAGCLGAMAEQRREPAIVLPDAA